MKINIIYFFLFLMFVPTYVNAEIKIAVIFKESDKYSKFQKDIYDSMIASLSLNKCEYQIELTPFFHDGSSEGINKAIVEAKKNNPDIVVGGETSQFAMIIARAFKNKIFITPTASSVTLNEVHPRPYRMIHADDQYVNVLKYAVNNYKSKRIAIFQNISFPNTNMISEKASEFLKNKKIEHIVVKVVTGEEIDEKKLAPVIKINPDIVVVFSFDNDLRKLVSFLTKKDIHPLYVGGDGWGRDTFLKDHLLKNGSEFTGIRAVYWNSSNTEKDFLMIRKSLEKKILAEVDFFHAVGYDTMKFIVDTLNKGKGVKEFDKTAGSIEYSGFLTTRKFRYNSMLYPVKDFNLQFLSLKKNTYFRYSE